MQFKKAKKINLYTDDGTIWFQKGIVNADDIKDQFNTVSDGYTIVQHNDIEEIVDEVVKDKNLQAVKRIEELNEGARLHIELTFPKITLDVENNGQQVALRCTYDNSYNGTTGLRSEIGAESPYGRGFLWVGGIIKALEDNYYHRHTKGVNIAHFEKKLENGIESFKTKIKKHFNDMFNTPLTVDQAKQFIEEVLEDKSKNKPSKKYLEKILNSLSTATFNNKWAFYVLICDVVTSEVSSSQVDLRNRQLKLIVTRLHKKIKSNNSTTASSSSTSEGNSSEGNEESTTNLITLNTPPEKVLSMKPKLAIKRINKKQFDVTYHGMTIKTFKKYKQASKYLANVA